jgi:hypothetical protein
MMAKVCSSTSKVLAVRASRGLTEMSTAITKFGAEAARAFAPGSG